MLPCLIWAAEVHDPIAALFFGFVGSGVLIGVILLISWLGGRVVEADAAMRIAKESDERREL